MKSHKKYMQMNKSNKLVFNNQKSKHTRWKKLRKFQLKYIEDRYYYYYYCFILFIRLHVLN